MESIYSKTLRDTGSGKSVDLIGSSSASGLVDTKKAAQRLGIEPGTLVVWRSTNRRVLPYVKIGSRVRYRISDLDDFIAANLHNTHDVE